MTCTSRTCFHSGHFSHGAWVTLVIWSSDHAQTSRTNRKIAVMPCCRNCRNWSKICFMAAPLCPWPGERSQQTPGKTLLGRNRAPAAHLGGPNTTPALSFGSDRPADWIWSFGDFAVVIPDGSRLSRADPGCVCNVVVLR